MNKNLSLGQRLMADTPNFFKKIDFLGLVLIGLAVTLKGILPAQYLLIMGTIGGTLTTISKFAVKDQVNLPALMQTDDPQKTVDTVTELANQATELKQDVQTIADQSSQAVASVEIPPVKQNS
jgi:hypothetical protein